MRVDVTAADITAGERYDHANCPVACALNRRGDGPWKVGQWRIEDAEGGLYVLPFEATCWIRAYEAGATVEPFSFVMWPR
jgi:hypothetical protein